MMSVPLGQGAGRLAGRTLGPVPLSKAYLGANPQDLVRATWERASSVGDIITTSIALNLWLRPALVLPRVSCVSTSSPIGLSGIALRLRELVVAPWLLQYALQYPKTLRPPDD